MDANAKIKAKTDVEIREIKAKAEKEIHSVTRSAKKAVKKPKTIVSLA